MPACDVPYREQDAWVPQWVLQAKVMEVGVMEDPWTQNMKGELEVLGISLGTWKMLCAGQLP